MMPAARPLVPLLACLLTIAPLGCESDTVGGLPQTDLPRGNLTLGGETFNVQIASTFETRRDGYMFTEHIDRNDGMIFLFPQPQMLGFWMKNVPIPLDIVFVRRDEITGKWIVDSMHRMQPKDTRTRHQSRRPCSIAIEFAAGTTDRLGLKAGDPVTFDATIQQAMLEAE